MHILIIEDDPAIATTLRFVADIPKTSVGKHDKKVIRMLVAEGKL